jgi:transposase-like protein
MQTPYWQLYMNANRHWLHQQVVACAQQQGLKAAARAFGCSRNTVRKWLRRFQPGKPSSLAELSKRPRRCPHQTPSSVEGLIVRLRHQTGFGAERLQREFAIPASVGAIARILRAHQLTRRRARKHQRKKCLRQIKRRWKLFGQLVADTKYLTDIPFYWPQMTRLRLPRYQYSVREVVSGLCLMGYADEVSKTYSCLLAEWISAHLADHGVDLSGVVWQTDNGSEFLENKQHRGLPSTVRALGSDHRYIPPKAYTWQSDVETVHSLQESEFFDRESFTDRADFMRKVQSYWHYFNLVRPNRGKEWQSPLQILRARAPRLDPALAHFPALDLCALHGQYYPRFTPTRGHHLPVYP